MQSKMTYLYTALILSFTLIPSSLTYETATYISIKQYVLLKESITCMQTTLWHEARSEGAEGIKAVGQVILNRSKAISNNPMQVSRNICKIVLKPKQFSIYNNISLKKASNSFKEAPESKVKGLVATLAFKAATEPLNPLHETIAKANALYYHTHKVKPVWRKKLVQVLDIGNHRFYTTSNKQEI